MRHWIIAVTLIGFIGNANATGFHHPPVVKPPVVIPPSVTPPIIRPPTLLPIQPVAPAQPVVPAQPAQPSQPIAGGSNYSWIGWTVFGAVAIYFAAAIYTHAACVADEDERKIPDKDRKCYRHVPQ